MKHLLLLSALISFNIFANDEALEIYMALDNTSQVQKSVLVDNENQTIIRLSIGGLFCSKNKHKNEDIVSYSCGLKVTETNNFSPEKIYNALDFEVTRSSASTWFNLRQVTRQAVC